MKALRFRFVAVLAAAAAAVSLSAQETPPTSSPAQGTPNAATSSSNNEAAQQILQSVQGYGSKLKYPALQSPSDRYVLKTGDTVSVALTLASQYNESTTVRPDGYIGLIGAPDVHVSGETEPEATETIRKAYEGILANPLLTVTVKSFESPFFVVGGEVKNPGKFVLHGDTTVAQSIAIAGGFNDGSAKDSKALLLRRVSRDYVQARLIDLKRIDKGNLAQDVRLQSGDVVFVPKNRLSKVQPFLNYFLAYRMFYIDLGPTIDTRQ